VEREVKESLRKPIEEIKEELPNFGTVELKSVRKPIEEIKEDYPKDGTGTTPSIGEDR